MNPALGASLAGLVATLGGISVTHIGSGVLPLEPTAEAGSYLWPTNKVYYGLKIRMANGQIWTSRFPVLNADGSITIELRRVSTQTYGTKVTVGAADINTPLFWAATVEYVEDPIPGTGEPVPVDPNTPPEPVPLPGGPQPGSPTPSPEPPVDPPVDPIPGL